tara:strand:+ start:162 stop:329 length:168 start_codon:yes stop_codon:yes gene_type:complete
MKNMEKKEYSHGDHMAALGRLTALYEVFITLQEKIKKQQAIIAKFDQKEKNDNYS